MIGLTSFSNSTARTRGFSLSSWEDAEPTATRLMPRGPPRAQEERRKAGIGAVRIVSAGLLFPCDAGRCLLSSLFPREAAASSPRALAGRASRCPARPTPGSASSRVTAGCRPECLARHGRDGRAHARAADGAAQVQPRRLPLARRRAGVVPHRDARPAAGVPGHRRVPRRRTRQTRRAARTRAEPGWKLGNPYWTGSARRLQLRVRGDVTRVRAFYLWSPVTVAPVARPVAAGPTRPAIITRAAWGADEQIVRGTPAYASRLAFSVVHHTAGAAPTSKAQSAAMVRGIQSYHVRSNGWNDIGYNFLVDPFGQVFEGRGGRDHEAGDRRAREGFNTGSVGVAVLGTYSRAGSARPLGPRSSSCSPGGSTSRTSTRPRA